MKKLETDRQQRTEIASAELHSARGGALVGQPPPVAIDPEPAPWLPPIVFDPQPQPW